MFLKAGSFEQEKEPISTGQKCSCIRETKTEILIVLDKIYQYATEVVDNIDLRMLLSFPCQTAWEQ